MRTAASLRLATTGSVTATGILAAGQLDLLTRSQRKHRRQGKRYQLSASFHRALQW
jgi:hypothetical protein